MANKSKKPACALVRAQLQKMDPAALVNLIGDIYFIGTLGDRASVEHHR